MLAAVGVILIVLGALLSAWPYNSLGNSVEVIAVRVDIPRGTQITRDSLQIVRLAVDPAIKAIPADQLNSVVGQRAAFDMAAGGLVVERAVTSETVPHKGKSVVGLSLVAGQLPGNALQVGDKVRVVAISNQTTDAGLEKLKTVDAVIISVLPIDPAGKASVSVEVAATMAPELAARAAKGQVALVLESREQ